MKRKAEVDVEALVRDAKRRKLVAALELRSAALKVVATELDHQFIMLKAIADKSQQLTNELFPDLNDDHSPVSWFKFNVAKKQATEDFKAKHQALMTSLDVTSAFAELDNERIDEVYRI